MLALPGKYCCLLRSYVLALLRGNAPIFLDSYIRVWYNILTLSGENAMKRHFAILLLLALLQSAKGRQDMHKPHGIPYLP